MARRLKNDLTRPIMMILDRARSPLSTGEICDLLAKNYQVTEFQAVNHGRMRPTGRLISGTQLPHSQPEICPKCDCTEEVEIPRRTMAPRVRVAMKRLTRRGSVVEIPTETPNNKGGHLWLRADRVDEYYSQMFS